MVADRGVAEPQPLGGALRPEHGAVEPGRGHAGGEGARVPTAGERPGGAGEPDAALGDKPLAPDGSIKRKLRTACLAEYMAEDGPALGGPAFVPARSKEAVSLMLSRRR